METKSTRDALLLRGVVLLAALAAALIMLTFGPVSRAQAAQTTCQDNSKSDCWAYDRWVLQNYSGYSGGSQVNNAYAGRSASFSFKGTSVKWITSRGPDYGKTAVYLDGREVKVYDGYASSASHKVVGFSRSNLANKKHTIKLVNTGKKNVKASSTYTGLDAFVAGGKTFQDTSPRITYGAWKGVRDSRALGGTYRIGAGRSTAHVADASTFTGSTVTFVTATGPNMSRNAVIGVASARTGAVVGSWHVDLYSASMKFQQTFPIRGLSSSGSYYLFVYSTDGRPVVFDAVQGNFT